MDDGNIAHFCCPYIYGFSALQCGNEQLIHFIVLIDYCY